MPNIWILLIFHILFINCATIKKVPQTEKTSEFWMEKGRQQMKSKLNQKTMTTRAKNIILFIGDGMGISTVTAARIFKNQRKHGSSLPDKDLIFETLPNIGLSKTYCVDDYVCDSASTATAILTGTKTNKRVLGLSPRIQTKNCKLYDKSKDDLNSIADHLYLQKKSLGIVTSSSLTGATPAALYAKTPNRSWKYKSSKRCPFKDIASQLISKADMFQVIFGGGRSSFLSRNDNDPEYNETIGSRKDLNLISKWKSILKEKSAKYIWNRQQFDDIRSRDTDYVLGLFEPYDTKFSDEESDDPKLDEMTSKAIQILSKNKNGFFLLVEEGKIDNAHHANQAYRAILQTLELEKAVKTALSLIDSKETLLIVTADHSHVMTFGGYSSREADITALNLGGLARDKRGYTSLLYGNGPGFEHPRENITVNTSFIPTDIYHAGIPLVKETHGGEEVSVYAQGPWAHLLSGLYEQSFIGHVMMFASCSGIYSDREGCYTNVGFKLSRSYFVILSLFVMRYY